MSTVVNVNPNILGGTPVFMGTRVPVASLFDYLAHGYSVEEFVEQFPSVDREQAVALLDEAKAAVVPKHVTT